MALAVALALPAQALAGDPTEAQYAAPIVAAGDVDGDDGGGVGGVGGSEDPPSAGAESVTPTSTKNIGALPFTGLDLAALVLVALALAGTGLALRRLSTFGETQR